MTDKQAALLIMQYARQLEQLSYEVDKLIAVGPRDKIQVWAGEGEEPIGTIERLETSFNNGWELREEGIFLATKLVKQFSEMMKDDAGDLLPQQGSGERVFAPGVRPWWVNEEDS